MTRERQGVGESNLYQIVYISSAKGAILPEMVDDIIEKSVRNNRRDTITGLLYHDGNRFLQALEGPEKMVEIAFRRILGDPRHRAVVTLSSGAIEGREFGDWAMAHRKKGEDSAAFVRQVEALVAKAAPSVRATFAGLAAHRAAA